MQMSSSTSPQLITSSSENCRNHTILCFSQAVNICRFLCFFLGDRLTSKELRERLGIDDIALVLQQNRLRWYGHVLRKDDDDWVKNAWSMKLSVQGQEEDQRGPGQRLSERTVKLVN